MVVAHNQRKLLLKIKIVLEFNSFLESLINLQKMSPYRFMYSVQPFLKYLTKKSHPFEM